MAVGIKREDQPIYRRNIRTKTTNPRRIITLGLCKTDLLFLDKLQRHGFIKNRSKAFEKALEEFLTEEYDDFKIKVSFING